MTGRLVAGARLPLAPENAERRRAPGDCTVANPIAPVVPELAIAFGDCDRPPMPAPSAAVTRKHEALETPRVRPWDGRCVPCG